MSIARFLTITAATLLVTVLTACSTYREAGGQNPDDVLISDANATITTFKQRDPSLQRFFDTAAGYAVFPKVTQGGAGIGAAHGRGVVYQNNLVMGFSELSAGSIGAQLGGQSYSEIIFFQNQYQLDQFKRGETKFSAQASAVAASNGSAAKSDYAEGVAVFITGQEGLMFDASIGGQGFSYRPR
jgi:lipid-binding SYLF domain-containing protein